LDHNFGIGLTLLACAGISVSRTGDKPPEAPTTTLLDEVAAKMDRGSLHAIGCEHTSGGGLTV
jgi:hypothetical protein